MSELASVSDGGAAVVWGVFFVHFEMLVMGFTFHKR